jgi:fibronectin-binding autotransporter adhesin
MKFSLFLAFVLSLGSIVISDAGSATWSATPATGTWNEFSPDNWVPTTVPDGVDDVATFGPSTITGILIVDIDIGAMTFESDASAYTFTMSGANTGLRVHEAGITNDSGMTQSFIINPPFGSISFFGSSTAGSSTAFTANPGRFGGETGATVYFYETSNAGSGTFTAVSEQVINGFGGGVIFHDESSAGDATLTAQGSSVNAGATIHFEDKSIGGNATLIAESGSDSGDGGAIAFDARTGGGTMRVILFGDGTANPQNGQLSVSPNPTAMHNLMIGSIEGGGQISLGALSGQVASITVGSNNLSTTFSGVISGFGTVTKVGTGALTLSGTNTYTGGTSVTDGTLTINNITGSGTGTGPVAVTGGTLAGNGIIAGAVTIGGNNPKPAILSPGGKKQATLTLQSSLTFAISSTYTCSYRGNQRKVQFDQVIANGVTIDDTSGFNFVGQTQGNLRLGTVLTVINNTSATPIAGTFNNLADGAVISASGGNFLVNYKGGDGNDLTLTLVQ